MNICLEANKLSITVNKTWIVWLCAFSQDSGMFIGKNEQSEIQSNYKYLGERYIIR